MEPTAVAPNPFVALGNDPARIRDIVEHFYDAMDRTEPALAKLHACDSEGRVSREARDRFGLFFIGWLGGPQDYIAQHGHPRLRMRHARVPVNTAMRDAWLRCIRIAFDECNVQGDVRVFLEEKLSDLADFMRNVRE